MTARVRMAEPAREWRAWQEVLEPAVLAVLRSGGYLGGAEVEACEREMAAFHGVSHGVACSSGTDALVLGLRAMGVEAGDEVITTPFTFAATAEAIVLVGARPVFADIDSATANLCPASVAARMTSKVRVVLPVHLFGRVADMPAFCALAQEHGVGLLEDAAQAHGTRLGGRSVGAWGDAAAFSFYPTKNLAACGDAGLLATRDAAIAAKARLLRAHGASARDWHEAIGYCARMDAVQAALLRVKLRKLEWSLFRRRQVAATYRSALADIPGLTLPPLAQDPASHGWHGFVVRTPQRAAARDALAAAGIDAAVYYARTLYAQPAYMDYAAPGDCPNAEAWAREALALPIHPWLTTEEIARVVSTLRKVL